MVIWTRIFMGWFNYSLNSVFLVILYDINIYNTYTSIYIYIYMSIYIYVYIYIYLSLSLSHSLSPSIWIYHIYIHSFHGRNLPLASSSCGSVSAFSPWRCCVFFGHWMGPWSSYGFIGSILLPPKNVIYVNMCIYKYWYCLYIYICVYIYIYICTSKLRRITIEQIMIAHI